MKRAYKYDVFISKESHNFVFSKKLYDFLTARGLKVFLSEIELPKMSNDVFKQSLDIGIANSHNLVVICSQSDKGSKWVEDEWTNFLCLRNTEKRDTRIFTIRTAHSNLDCIPQGIKHFESFDEREFERLYLYLVNQSAEDSQYIAEKRNEYLGNFSKKALQEVRQSYFNLNAENYTPADEQANSQLENNIFDSDSWDFLDSTENVSDGEEMPYENDESSDDCISSVLDIIDRTPRCIIVGNPGSGKTTTLKKVLLDKCSEYTDENKSFIPVYIQLSRLGVNANIVSVIEETVGGNWISHYLNLGLVLILFDGLNEIQNSIREDVVSSIGKFLSLYSSCHVIFTSRVYGFVNHFNLPVYRLLELTSDNVNDYIRQKGANVGIYESIERSRDLKALATSPLLVNMIIDVWKKKKTIPKNRGQLYLAFINNNFGRETKKRIITPHLTHIKKILGHLAYDMKKSNILFFDRETVSAKLNTINTLYGLPYDCNSLFEELLEEGILIENAPDDFTSEIGFNHETFLEFFAAFHMAGIYLNNKKWPVTETNSDWHEIFKMSVELVSSSLDHDGRIALIDDFCRHLRAGLPYNTDVNIASAIRIFSSISLTIPEFRNYLEQYVFHIILSWENYFSEDSEPEPTHLEGLFTAIAALSSEPLFKILIFNDKWNRYWLGRNMYENLRRILYTETSDKLLLYDWIDYATTFFTDSKIKRHIGAFSAQLLRHMSNAELADMYQSTGSLLYLFNMTDVDYIQSNISNHSDSQINAYSHLFANNKYTAELFQLVSTLIFSRIKLQEQKKILKRYITWCHDSDFVYDYIASNIDSSDLGSFIRRTLSCKSSVSDRYVELFKKLEITVPKTYCTFVENDGMEIGGITISKQNYTIDGVLVHIAKTPALFPYAIRNSREFYHKLEIAANPAYIEAVKKLHEDEMRDVIKAYGLFGFLPTESSWLWPESKFMVVSKTFLSKTILSNAESTITIPASWHSEYTVQPGDILFIFKRRKIFKVENNDRSVLLGYKKGVVVGLHGSEYCFIRVDGESGDYFTPAKEWPRELHTGDWVEFYPSLNSHAAYRNRKIAIFCTICD